MMLGYFGLALTIFYTAYYLMISNEKPSMWSYSVAHYLIKTPIPFQRKCVLYYMGEGRLGSQDMAEDLTIMLKSSDIDGELRDMRSYKHFKELVQTGTVKEPANEMLDVSREFSVLLKVVKTPSNNGEFDVLVTGGKTILFGIPKHTLKSEHVKKKICELIRTFFFKYEGMPSTRMTPLLDINFLLMSDNKKVEWNVKEDITNRYFRPIINVLSLFYDISIHNRVISGAKVTKRMKLKDSEDGTHSIVDLQEQGAELFDLLERVSTVEVATVNSAIYRHNLAFVCLVPQKKLLFFDPVLKRKTDSVGIKGFGILSIFNIEEEVNQQNYALTAEDVLSLVGTWATHLRKMHNLPTTITETMLDGMGVDDAVTVVEEGEYMVETPDLKFSIKLEKPGLTAFYGYEVAKIAESLYRLYLKGAVDNLQKVIDPLQSIGFMTNVSKNTLEHTKKAYEAISTLYEPQETGKVINNVRKLNLARSAFKHSLEALGDNDTYAKNVVSMEHGFAMLMCDVFPFVFPLLANAVKCALNK